jgi:rubrerythrin
VCRQVFQKKRKEFNAQDQRLVANEQKKLMKRGEAVEKKLEEKKAKEKVPKWKADSLALRSGIKQNRDDGYEPTKEEKQILEDARNSQFTKCQFCGRSFNGEAAKKHIPFCESQQKKNQMRRK